MSALTIQVESKGYNCGYSAWIGVNGEDVGKNRYGRGINVATLDNNRGSLLEFRNFDTHGNERAATELAEFISALAPGTIVVMAVQDEATYKLHERSRQACHSVGSALIYQLDYGDSWAIIGQKGALGKC